MSHLVRIAHRGASGKGHAPENTLAAFRRAIEMGVDCVECDVHSTKDGQVVVIHDNSINRTTDMKGNIAELTLDEIKKADAGSWFSPEFAQERIPALRELLEITKGKVITVIEIKPDNITDRVVWEVVNSGAVHDVILQSFHPNAVRDALKHNPRIPRALLVGNTIGIKRLSGILELIHKAVEAGASVLNLADSIISPELVRESHRRGIGVWAWTVDDDSKIRQLIEMNVDGITTNYPEKLVSDKFDDRRL